MIDYSDNVKPYEDKHSDEEIALFCTYICSEPILCEELRLLCERYNETPNDEYLVKYIWGAKYLPLNGIEKVSGLDGFEFVIRFAKFVQSLKSVEFINAVGAMLAKNRKYAQKEIIEATDISSARSDFAPIEQAKLVRDAAIVNAADTYASCLFALQVWDGTGTPPSIVSVK